MPRSLVEYLVFIASPGGLDKERELFRNAIVQFNEVHGNPNGVVFAPIGWEDTLPGMGRPQELINNDLRRCDYAVFILHDRWGTSTGGKSSGTEEEWALAQELYTRNLLRSICLLFKDVDARKMRDSGPQLKQVLKFKKSLEGERKFLFQKYADIRQFRQIIERHLAKWLRDHNDGLNGRHFPSPAPVDFPDNAPSEQAEPSVQYWLAEGRRLVAPATLHRDPQGALFCAERAIRAAKTDIDLGRAENARGVAKYHSNDWTGAIDSFNNIIDRLAGIRDLEGKQVVASSLVNKGITLGALERGDEAIAVYEDIIRRYGTESDLALREQVAHSLVNKGITLGVLGRRVEEIAAYDDVVNRFEGAVELALREPVANALVNKAITLGDLGHPKDAIEAYDDVVGRFGMSREPTLLEQVSTALVNKGIRLGTLGRDEEAIAVYDDIVSRFGGANELALREQVAKALLYKAFRLLALTRGDEAMAVLDEVVGRFGAAREPSLRGTVDRVERFKYARLHGIKLIM
ncbi:DUF4062 domain-containing protein [Bradyrhizobium sp.]